MAIVLMAVIGWRQYYLGRKTLKIRKKYNNDTVDVVARVFAVIFDIALVVQSHAGVFQFLNNLLVKGEDPRLSLILFPIVIAGVGFMAWLGFALTAIMVSNLRIRVLKAERKKVCDKMKRENSNRRNSG